MTIYSDLVSKRLHLFILQKFDILYVYAKKLDSVFWF